MINNQQFLSSEESMEVEKALLTSEEKFLTRLTISSLRMLILIAQNLDLTVEELTPEQIISWMEKDSKIRQELGQDQTNLKW